MKQFFLIIAWLSVSFKLQAQPELGPLIADFDQHYAAQLAKHDIPGGAYAIVQGNRIIATAGFGVRQLGQPEPVDPYTVFRIASVSKTFAAGLASVLEQQGHFSWDDKLVDYLPGFSFKSKKYNRQLKLKHLLSQSTGVMPNAYDNLIEANVPLERILPQFGKIDPLCPPGQCYGYQNVLFSLIEPVMQQATGKNYAQLLQERIFTPLQLPTASVGLDGFFSTEETSKILEAGAKYGLKPKIHANQLHYSGGIQVCVKYNAISVDHLECVGDDETKRDQHKCGDVCKAWN